MKLPPTKPKATPDAVLVSICPRCRRLIKCPGLTAITCGGEHGCGATHDRVWERGDA
jgi:hypothetical protein